MDARKEKGVDGSTNWTINVAVGRVVQRIITRMLAQDLRRLKESSRRTSKEDQRAKMERACRGCRRKEEEGSEAGSQREVEKDGTEAETMKGLLEEANKMLKGISARNADQDRLAVMQKQLDELRQLRVLRLTKLNSEKDLGLIDSGATHPLRGRKGGEEWEGLEEVWGHVS